MTGKREEEEKGQEKELIGRVGRDLGLGLDQEEIAKMIFKSPMTPSLPKEEGTNWKKVKYLKRRRNPDTRVCSLQRITRIRTLQQQQSHREHLRKNK